METSSKSPDPLGRAMFDYQRDEMGEIVYRDGATVRDGHVEEYYYEPRESWSEGTVDLLERIVAWGEPILDAGCGAGQHVRWFEDRDVNVVGIDRSPNAVESARERGCDDVRVMDMFDLDFERGQFRTIYALGTQVGLGRSLAGVRSLLSAVADVTDDEGRCVLHNYDPTMLETEAGANGDDSLLGYRSDPRPGIAHRAFHFEYEPAGEAAATLDGLPRRAVGRTLQFLLFSPDRLREAAVGTPWSVTDVSYDGSDRTYVAILEKRRTLKPSS